MRSRVQIVFAYRTRPRPNNAHFPSKDVEKLREFINAYSPKKMSKRNHARISHGLDLGHRFFLRHQSDQIRAANRLNCHIGSHRSELQTLELPPQVSHARLSEKYRSWRDDLDQYRDTQHHRREYEYREYRKRYIKRALCLCAVGPEDIRFLIHYII